MTVSVLTDRLFIRARSHSRRFVRVRIQAPEISREDPRPSADIAFVLDRSGSMAGSKFQLARKAIEQAVHRLGPNDAFSLVVYDDQIDVVQPATAATAAARRVALQRLAQITPRGTTNLSDGWLTGCGQIAETLAEDRIGRCLLLTDGLANRGITDPLTLANHARELRKRGVSTSTFGVGADFDEVLLGQMADAGGGAFSFIETPEQIPELINQELGETLEIVARKVVLEVHLPAGVSARPVGPYPIDTTDKGIRVVLPDLVSGQDLDLPLRLRFSPGPRSEQVEVRFTLHDAEGVFGTPTVPLQWTWAGHSDNDNQPRNIEIDRLVAERYASIAREEAARLNRDGQYKTAARRLTAVADKIAEYAGHDDELKEMVRALKRDARRYSRVMDQLTRKSLYTQSSSLARGGLATGKLRKRR
jgi:Ca-activated chloride channel family protein